MLVDKKRENMYFECRARKISLDKKLAKIKAVLIVPPALLLIGTVIFLIMLMFSDILVMAAGAIFYGYQSKGAPIAFLFDIIVYSGYIFMAVSLTVFKTEFFLKKFHLIYGVAIFVFFLFYAICGYNFTYVAIGIISLIAGIINKKLVDEDRKMSLLEGYPHFNPNFMRNTDAPFVPATSDELDGMTADDRIMYEREH